MSPGAQMTGGPQRMKANWKTVETKCLTCSGPFSFGEDVCLCMICGGTHHALCWDSSGGCTHQGGPGPSRGATVVEGATTPPPGPPQPGVPPYGPPQPLPTYSYAPPPPPVQPPPMQAPPLAADEQYCPKCGNVVKTNAMSCRFCNAALPYAQAPVFGGPQPYGMAGGVGYPAANSAMASLEIDRKASSARTCGLISLITIACTNLFSIIAVASEDRDLLRFMVSARPVFGVIGIGILVLAIVAVVKASGAKRLMYQFPVEPGVRSRATAGQVMGWITLGIFVLGIIMVAARGGRGL